MHSKINIILIVYRYTTGEYVLNELLDTLFFTSLLTHNLDIYLYNFPYGFHLNLKDNIEVNITFLFL